MNETFKQTQGIDNHRKTAIPAKGIGQYCDCNNTALFGHQIGQYVLSRSVAGACRKQYAISNSEELFVVGISCCIHFVCQLLYFCIYLPGYLKAAPGYEKYRINKGVKRAWEDNPKWDSEKFRLISYLGVNYCLMYPGLITASTWLSGIKVRFDDLPTTYVCDKLGSSSHGSCSLFQSSRTHFFIGLIVYHIRFPFFINITRFITNIPRPLA